VNKEIFMEIFSEVSSFPFEELSKNLIEKVCCEIFKGNKKL